MNNPTDNMQPQEARFAVYATGALLALVAVLHVIFGIVTGKNDQDLEQLQDALIPLFVGSIVLDRAMIHRIGSKLNGTVSAISADRADKAATMDGNEHNG